MLRVEIEREAKDAETNVVHVVSREREKLLAELRQERAVFEKNQDVGQPPDLLSKVRLMVNTFKSRGQELAISDTKSKLENYHRNVEKRQGEISKLKPYVKGTSQFQACWQEMEFLEEKIDGVIDSISDHNEDVDRLINEATDFQKMLDLEISRYRV